MPAVETSVAQTRRSRTVNLWLAGSVVVLTGAVVVLAILLARQGRGPSTGNDGSAPVPMKALAMAGPDGGSGQAGHHAQTPPRPYIAVPGPGAPSAPPSVPGAPRTGPLAGLFRNFGSILNDPDLKRSLSDLRKQLQKGMGSFGKLFGGLPGGPGSTSPPRPNAPPAADPFSDLLNQAMRAFGMNPPGTPSAPGTPHPPSDPHRIEAQLKDTGTAFVVRCRFPGARPESASFRLQGQTLVIKARFPGGDDREKEVPLPAAVNQLGARSELKQGRLVVTLPKAVP